MNILLISGFNAPPDGNGLMQLGLRIQKLRPLDKVDLIKWYEEFPFVPDVIIAHSYGVSSAILWLRKSPTLKLKLLVLLDGVPIWSKGLWQGSEWVIPDNVDRAVSWKRTWFAWIPPWSSDIRNMTAKDLVSGRRVNNYVNLWHNDIPGDPAVHDAIVNEVQGLT